MFVILRSMFVSDICSVRVLVDWVDAIVDFE